jgi:D-tyrosyl-tRNA(Tyr) deacylase
MRAVVQRVSSSSVTVDHRIVGQIERGFLVLLGITADDTVDDVIYTAAKIIGLRVFEDENGKMNLSLPEIGGAMLIVSQFTLYGDCRKGKRPSFITAARPEVAQPLYERFISEVRAQGIPVKTGIFQAQMEVAIVNDGPVTLLIDSRKTF